MLIGSKSECFAIDPDIPPQAQRVVFLRSGDVPPDRRWRLDGCDLSAAVRTAWSPWPGRHRLELVDGRGAVREGVDFDVRGVQLKARRR